MNAPQQQPIRRVVFRTRVAPTLQQLAAATWGTVTASSEDRAAVLAFIAEETFRPGVVRHEVVVEVERAGVATHWCVRCDGEGYAAFGLDDDQGDHAEDSDPGEESDHGGAALGEDDEDTHDAEATDEREPDRDEDEDDGVGGEVEPHLTALFGAQPWHTEQPANDDVVTR